MSDQAPSEWRVIRWYMLGDRQAVAKPIPVASYADGLIVKGNLENDLWWVPEGAVDWGVDEPWRPYR